MAAVIAVVLLVLLVQDIPLAIHLQAVEHDRIITSLERDAFVLAGRGEEAVETVSTRDDPGLARAARDYRDAGGARVVIVNAEGTAIVTSDDDQSKVGASYSSRTEIAQSLAGDITSGHRYSETLSTELLYVTVPIFSGSDVVGAVRLTYPDQVVTDAVNGQIRLLGLVALTTLLLAGIVGFIFSGTVTRRLTLLGDATGRLADGDLTARADEASGAPELRTLSRSFNRMAERLEVLIEQQRSFAADASHQLRTPLTALRLRLELARELLDTHPAAAADRLSAAEAEADRLGNIIEGLLLLSRTEATTAPVDSVDLAEVARTRVAHWHPLAQESGVRIRYEGPETADVVATPLAPEQIIDNFIDNALSASPVGGTITVRVAAAGPDSTAVHVLDRGYGLSEEDCVKAFDRFWRAGHHNAGSGLGLSIVAQLARASRATAALDPRPDGGLDASVRFIAAH